MSEWTPAHQSLAEAMFPGEYAPVDPVQALKLSSPREYVRLLADAQAVVAQRESDRAQSEVDAAAYRLGNEWLEGFEVFRYTAGVNPAAPQPASLSWPTGVALTGERRVLGLELAAGNDEGSAWNSMAARNSPIRSGLTRMETNTASTIRGSLGAQQVGQRGRTAPRPSWEAARLRPRRPVG